MMLLEIESSYMQPQFYSLLGDLLRYPEERSPKSIVQAKRLADIMYPQESHLIQSFADEIGKLNFTEWEEKYVSTFDVMAVCCLDVGYVKFGEDYKRGQFLAELKVICRKHQIDCGSELPDFLPNILRILPKLNPKEAALLCHEIVIPAVQKMVEQFKDGENSYRYLLEFICQLLKKDYGER